MNKGTVLSIDSKWAYIFTEDCRVLKLHAQPFMQPGTEIDMEAAKRAEARKTRTLLLKPALAFISLILIAALVLIGQGIILTPVYATISVDVNPSVQLELNKSLDVISVRAMNQEAKELMAGLELKGINWEEAVFRWTKIIREKYPQKAETILISAVMPETEEHLRARLMVLEQNKLEGTMEQSQVRVIYTFDKDVTGQAKMNGLSVGRQMLYNQAKAQNQNWEEEDIGQAALGDLVRTLLIKEDRDQTDMTRKRHTETRQETTIDREPSGNQETNRSTNQEAGKETNRSTQIETGGTNQETSDRQPTNQETNRETHRETAGAGTEEEKETPPTYQETNRETKRITNTTEPEQDPDA